MPEAKSGAEGGSRTDAASPPDPEAPAVDVTQGSGLSDPRESLPGPHLGV
jgi:hypothetical protein